ncbi:MAG: acyl-CoA dehydrogenase family protein [Proteobacteria bacterium]|nr:acyl-CoA dehydrogenase family protein [Pseudomonadota bacterium]
MKDDSAQVTRRPHGAHHIAPDCAGMDFWQADAAFRSLLSLYMDPDWLARMTPHFARLGALAGGRLDALAREADRNVPLLHARDKFGRDEDWIEYHAAYREMEAIAFNEYGLHAMSHRPGVLGMPEAAPPLVKYAFTYLFVQGEFGLMCPVSVSDTSNFVLKRFGSDPLKSLLLDRMLSQDPATMLKGTQFMTEKAAGSDVGALETEAEALGANADGLERFRIHGEKWFCSHADADVALMLARPRGAPPGTKGLALFAMPRRTEDDARNAYRIVRLKDKLGTRSMASGEIRLEGALAYLVGDASQGFKQMMQQVNLSRLSHGVRAASMMRRCLNESLAATRGRRQFGRAMLEVPLQRRQLLKIMLPTEQALSMYGLAAESMGRAEKGDTEGAALLRILTPVYKFRACRDNIRVASLALEIRGGLGYIEEWATARLARDAQVGTLWEGTSNINALDVVTRAVAKSQTHEALADALRKRLSGAAGVPAALRTRLEQALARATAFAGEVAADPKGEREARRAASVLYHATTAILLAWEGATLGARGGDARRLILARLVLDHRLAAADPLARDANRDAAGEIEDLLLGEAPVALARAQALAA